MNRKGFFALLSRVWMTMLRQLQTSFRYRKSGGDDNNKLPGNNGRARIEKIYGNTVVWNQFAKEINLGVFSTNYGTLTFDNNIAIYTSNTQGGYAYQEIPNMLEHRVYLSANIKLTTARTNVCIKIAGNSKSFYTSENTNWQKLSGICTGNNNTIFIVQDNATSNFDAIYITKMICVDLTKMFGSDSNICTALGVSNLTDSANLTKAAQNFEKLFPNSYYPYCTGRLINLGGYGVKWNQLVQNKNRNYTNSLVDTRTNFKQQIQFINDSSVVYAENIYNVPFIIRTPNSTYNRIAIKHDGSSRDLVYLILFTSVLSHVLYVYYDINSDDPTVVGGLDIRNIMVFDLTEMFGPGSEPTLEEFEAMFPDDYYEYNAGTEMNILDAATGENKLELESTGFNLWDEEWELGRYSDYTGEFMPGEQRVTSSRTHKIPIIGGQTYFFRVNGSFGINVMWFDANDKFLNDVNHTNTWYLPTGNGTLTAPTNADYIKFYMGSAYGTIYNNDICINISDPNRNGTYEPYKKDTLDLDWIRNEGVENFNIWDEEWEIGALIGNGTLDSSESNRRTTPYIEILPDTYYCISSKNINAGDGRFVYYDENKNFISYKGSGILVNTSYKSPNNARYWRITLGPNYGTTYNHDICINISNPALNGEYHPYGEKAKYFPQGLLSAGNVYDEVQGNKLIKRVGVVDLGSLTWNKYPSTPYGTTFYSSDMSNAKTTGETIVCSRYTPTVFRWATPPEDSCYWGVNGYHINRLCIHDESYSTAPTPQDNWLDGVVLYYELATPIEIPLSTPHKLIYRANKYCTEEILPRPIPGSSPLSSSIIADITYQNK